MCCDERGGAVPHRPRRDPPRYVPSPLHSTPSLNPTCPPPLPPPPAPYFRDAVTAADLDDLNIEIIRNTLYKSYLEDFDAFCRSVGGPTADVMHAILAFEADRRALNITINSFGTQLSKEQRAKLFPAIGRLFPEGNNALARADDVDQVRQAVESIAEYRAFFDTTPGGARQPNGAGAGSGGAGESVHTDSLFEQFPPAPLSPLSPKGTPSPPCPLRNRLKERAFCQYS